MVKLIPKKISEATRVAHDAALESAYYSVERKIDRVVDSALQNLQNDPWKPKVIGQMLQRFWKVIWPEISDAVKEDMLEERLKATPADSRDLKLARKEAKQVWSWPATHPRCPNFVRYARCQLLYSLMPADKPIWWVIQQPTALIFILLCLLPLGISLLPLTILFLAIDRSDEFQLANYMVINKLAWVGQRVILGAVGFGQMYLCTTNASCESTGPGVADWEQVTILALGPQQLLVVIAAVFYLHTRFIRLAAFKRAVATKTAKERGLLRRAEPTSGLRSLLPFGSSEPPDLGQVGHLEVQIVSAADLIPRDSGGKSDPFVVAALGGVSRRTQMVKRSLNPRWDERLGFEGTLASLIAKSPLKLRVWDYDVGSFHDLLGEAQIALDELAERGSVPLREHTLRGVPSGTLALKMSWKPRAQSAPRHQAFPAAQMKKLPIRRSASGTADINTRGVLEVHIVRAQDLEAADSSGSSDPFAVVYVGAKKRRTRTKRRTLNPAWDERFKFEGAMSELTVQPLRLVVWDYDLGSSNELLGEVEVPLDDLLTLGFKQCLDLPLKGVSTGTVTVLIAWRSHSPAVEQPQSIEKAPPAPAVAPEQGARATTEDKSRVSPSRGSPGASDGRSSGPSPRADPRPRWFAPDAERRGEIEVHLISAKDLASEDLSRGSDPYATVCHGVKKKRSKTVKKSLDPKWDERFVFEGVLGELADEPLIVKLWDYDSLSLDDGLGEVEIILDPLLESGVVHAVDERVVGADSGSVCVSVYWFPYDDEQSTATRMLRCSRSASKRQKPQPSANHLLRGAFFFDLFGLALIVVVGSADVIYRLRAAPAVFACLTDFFPLWFDYYTLDTTGMERSVLWYMAMLTTLHSIPLLIFKLPALGPILLRLEVTAYDRAGHLRLVLSQAKMVAKYKKEVNLLQQEEKKSRSRSDKFAPSKGRPPANADMV